MYTRNLFAKTTKISCRRRALTNIDRFKHSHDVVFPRQTSSFNKQKIIITRGILRNVFANMCCLKLQDSIFKMSTAKKAAAMTCCCVVLVCILLTTVSIYTAATFCGRDNKKRADCAEELLDDLVNITSNEAKSQCLSRYSGQLHTQYGVLQYTCIVIFCINFASKIDVIMALVGGVRIADKRGFVQ